MCRWGSNWSAMAAASRMCTWGVEERMITGFPSGEVHKLASLLTACAHNLT